MAILPQQCQTYFLLHAKLTLALLPCSWRRNLDRVAVSLQRRRKGLVQRRRFLEVCNAVVALQAAVRMHQARSRFQALRGAVTVLQSHWRGRRARAELAQRQHAAAVIQADWKCRVLRRW